MLFYVAHKIETQKSDEHDERKQEHAHTGTDTHLQTYMAAPVPRSRVASDVFTLVRGDCYFCAEPANSIIHRGCWCTHFTSIRKECVCTCARRPPAEDEPLTHHATQKVRKEERGGKGKGAVMNMAIKRDMKQEVRIKEQKEKRDGIQFPYLLSMLTVLLPILSSSINGYKEKYFLNYQQN